MTHSHVTPAAGLRPQEAVRLGFRTIVVHRVDTGRITYRGSWFGVAYLTGASKDGPVRITVPADMIVIACS
jgi:hypothetical protein